MKTPCVLSHELDFDLSDILIIIASQDWKIKAPVWKLFNFFIFFYDRDDFLIVLASDICLLC
ncbi:MAG: hypothetical protein CMM39_04480 [Rhodospirillaceae bacterium]|nr:hypothetical protein [Rhodospirillaceae bacterium]